MKIGDKVMICHDLSDTATIKEVVIEQFSKGPEQAVKCSGKWYYLAYIFPMEYAPELIEVVKERQRLKKEFDESMKLVYALRNKITKETKANS